MEHPEKIASLQAELDSLRDPDFGYIRAGLPRYGRLFGRDSLIVAWQRLEREPEIAVKTLRLLASLQGRVNDPINEEAPGKILHEWSPSPVPWVPWTFPYYGSVDATPLFVLVAAWTISRLKDEALTAELWPAVRKACGWIAACLETDQLGLLSYSPSNPLGLRHHGWKDTANVGPVYPTAMVEVQGYAYSALLHGAALADQRDPGLAGRWRDRAGSLKRQFNRLFWLKEHDNCALAVHGGGQIYAVDSSNPGHLLFTGILDEEYRPRLIKRLFRSDLFTAYGLRTLSTDDPSFGADEYHRGSVWPHDNWIFSEGLRALGFDRERGRVKAALLKAYDALGGMPEHYAVSRAGQIAAISSSARPQAWAAGGLLNLLDSSLNKKTALRILPPGR